MEKVYVVTLLLVVVLASIISDNAVDAQRRSRIGSRWGRQRNTRTGSGSFSVRGTAGGQGRQDQVSSKPTAADCSVAGFYPTPGSCTAFYRCVDWIGDGSFFSVFNFKCPVGTVFDDELDICNHPWATRPECSGADSTAAVTTAPTVAPTEPTTVETTPVVTTSAPTTAVPTTDAPTTADTTPAITTAAPTTVSSDDSSISTTQPSGVFTITCFQDNKYRRHPLYCNKYFYCIFDGDVWSVPTFTCPKDLIYDEEKQMCSTKDVSKEDCTIAPHSLPIDTTTIGEDGVLTPTATPVMPTETPIPTTETPSPTTETPSPTTEDPSQTKEVPSEAPSETTELPSEAPSQTTEVPSESTAVPTEASTTPVNVPGEHTEASIDITTSRNWETAEGSLHTCPAPGYYDYEYDCERFYKCVETEESDELLGLLYRCPENYGYTGEIQRCKKTEDLPACDKPVSFILRDATATQLYPDDLRWFFKN